MIYLQYQVQFEAVPFNNDERWRYDEAVYKIEQEFRKALYLEYGHCVRNQVLHEVWHAAYDRGHSAGFSAIEDQFISLLNFARVVLIADKE